ncbi:MAG: hypothetical protein ACRCX2_20240 [Paraclostridium sp.]
MLVSSGADEAAVFMVPEFSHISLGDGEVISMNEKFITIKYDDKNIGEVSYRLDNVERNSAKGYFLKNDFIVDSKMKVGKKIKKGSIIAYNKDFFKKKANGKISLCAGSLIPVLVIDDEGTWEDSSVVSESLSSKLTTKLIKRVTARFNLTTTDILDVNLNIGEHVDPHTMLMKYNDLTADSGLNEFFDNVEGVNTNEIEAHYKGILNDITVYYRLSRDTVMTKSVKQFLRDLDIIQTNKNHMKDLNNNKDKWGVSMKSSRPQLLTRGKFSKINGDVIENGEILIEFNIEVEDKVGPSDKIVVDRALKCEPSYLISNEDRPYGALSGRKADLLIDTQSLNARKTPGIVLHGELLGILLHVAIKNRMILNKPPEKDSLLDYKSSMDMVEGKLKYKE